VLHRGDFIASGGAGGELRVWDLASREMVCNLKHHALAIIDLKVSPHTVCMAISLRGGRPMLPLIVSDVIQIVACNKTLVFDTQRMCAA
jgi:hypothetical protein